MGTSFFSFSLALLLLNSLTLSSTTFFNYSTDHYALLAIKNNIILDPYGILSKNWSNNISFCYWIGVSCSIKHQRVTALNISSYKLKGTIAPYVGNLTFLQSLDISSNNFTGFMPSELSNLHRLKEINLADNQITGSIPNGIFNMSSLIEINMKNNRLSGKLSNDICSNIFPKLKRIYLSGNQLHGEIPANIYKCRELEDLILMENNLEGNIPSEIGNLTMLRILFLRSNYFEGPIPSSIFNISSLRIMNLSNNNLSGTIPSGTLHNLLEIEELYFSSNNFTGGIPKQFGNLTSLKWLEFASNRLTGELPEGLRNLPYLEVFAAPFNELSGSIPFSIFNMSTLRKLALQQNFFSGGLPANMGHSLINLEELYLFFNRLTGEIPSSIANASRLTVLELNRNSFSGLIPNFGNLRYLKILRLWENKLTGAESPTQELGFLSSLRNCKDLEILQISDNQLNGILPASIGNLSASLVMFWASRSNIKGRVPPEIGNLNSLQSLRLSDNQLTGFIPTTIGKLKQIYEIYLGGNLLQGYIPDGICQMSNLGMLNLSFNLFTGPIHECLGELKSLRTVSFASNKLNSTIPSRFWDLTDLVILDLSSNYLSGQLSPKIGSWKINQLDLSSNQFTGDIPSSIRDCQSLELLLLSNNKFTGSIPEFLGKVSGLRTLDLSNNDLSGLIPKSLEDLRVLEYFNLSYNKLEGEIPDGGSFANLTVFTAQSFAHNFALCGASRFQVPPCNHGRSRSKSVGLILKYILPAIIAAIILVGVVLMLIRRRKQINLPPSDDISLEKIAWRRISYIELDRGTSSFSETNLIGRGSYGSVFKATLSDGLNIAVKVFNLQLEGATKSFDNESEILSSIRHRNLVRIIGCCSNTEFKALILEYMPNGSLEKWLHSDNYFLDLVQRHMIASHVALAVEYLHHGHTFPVVHCDIKPSNVLLDEDMTARVGDFGISKLFDEGETMIQTTTMATIGYAAPEYGLEGKVSTSGDVYSFGILLLEMFTRKKPTDDMFSVEMSLKEWVSDALQENGVSTVVAPGLLSGEDQHFCANLECVSSIFDLAMKCLAHSPDERINMIQVVAALQKIKPKLQQQQQQQHS